MARDKLMEVLKLLRAEKDRLEATIETFERLVEEDSREKATRMQMVKAQGRQSAPVYPRDCRTRKRK